MYPMFNQISDTEVESYPANDGSTTEHINNENETEQRKEMKEVESQGRTFLQVIITCSCEQYYGSYKN